MRAIGPTRHVWVEEIMGTQISIHIHCGGPRPAENAEPAVRACFAELREIDRVFSTYRHDSDISRMGRGELDLKNADPRVAVVAAGCREAAAETDGLFSAHWAGSFDPTGYVKGWAVENAARRHLQPLVHDAIAAGINAGGDMQLFTAADTDWSWNVAIADPHRPGLAVATMAITNGAVATSGTGERGHHIIDPRTGQPATGIAGATVVADGLASADLWATAAVVAGFENRSWIGRAETLTGLLVADDGRVSRWLGSTQIDVTVAA